MRLEINRDQPRPGPAAEAEALPPASAKPPLDEAARRERRKQWALGLTLLALTLLTIGWTIAANVRRSRAVRDMIQTARGGQWGGPGGPGGGGPGGGWGPGGGGAGGWAKGGGRGGRGKGDGKGGPGGWGKGDGKGGWGKGGNFNDPQRQAQMVDRMTKDLGLSAQQKAQAETILKDSGPKLQAIRDNKSLTREQRREQFRQVRNEQVHKMMDMLTPAQKEKVGGRGMGGFGGGEGGRRRGRGGPPQGGGGPAAGAPPAGATK